MKKLVIFDLDGTLLNTIADLAHSTNHALRQNGFPTHDVKEYNFFVGNGINKLFERALPEGEKTEENILKVREEFLKHYDLHNTDRSVPYPGIPELLALLQERGIKLASLLINIKPLPVSSSPISSLPYNLRRFSDSVKE